MRLVHQVGSSYSLTPLLTYSLIRVTGNVATEDVLWMLQGLGIKSGVDLDKLLVASAFIDKALSNR